MAQRKSHKEESCVVLDSLRPMNKVHHKNTRKLEAHRIFFPAAALYAAITIWIWLAIRSGGIAAPALLTPGLWHAQEMIFGYAFAVIAGYLLPPQSILKLICLAGLWLIGRLIWFSGTLLPEAVLVVSASAFPLALSWLGASRFKAAKRPRNRVFAVILLCLGILATAVYLLAYMGQLSLVYAITYCALYLIVLFIIVMGGRLIPPATIGALRETGLEVRIPFQPTHESLSIALAAALAICELLKLDDLWGGIAALALGMTLIARMRTWYSLKFSRLGQVWPLHLGYAWIALGLVLFGLAKMGAPLNGSDVLHLVTLGGVGTITLTMLIRVTQQRQRGWQISPLGLTLIQLLLVAAVIARFATGWLPVISSEVTLLFSACCWSAAFILFLFQTFPAYLNRGVSSRVKETAQAQE